jgi:hypothetical protein
MATARAPPTVALHTLPTDLQESIAAQLPPSGLLSLAATCRPLAPLAASRGLWRRMHTRHLPSAWPPPRDATKAGFAAAAAAYAARFHISNVAVLPDTPVHIHSNTVQAVRASGGADKCLKRHAPISYYVVPHDVRRPGSALGLADGAVELVLRAAEAHPVDGLVVRVVHGLQAELGCARTAAAARVEVVVNGSFVLSVAVPAVGVVGCCDVLVPGAAVRAGRTNTVAVRCFGVDGVSWWLREVAVAAVIVGMPAWDASRESVSLPVAIPRRRFVGDEKSSPWKRRSHSKIRVQMHESPSISAGSSPGSPISVHMMA